MHWVPDDDFASIRGDWLGHIIRTSSVATEIPKPRVIIFDSFIVALEAIEHLGHAIIIGDRFYEHPAEINSHFLDDTPKVGSQEGESLCATFFIHLCLDSHGGHV